MHAEILRTVAIFKDLDPDELTGLAGIFTTREFAPKSCIITEGKRIQQFFVVCSGTVHVRRMARKREVLLARIGKGGIFGEVNLFDEGSATASVYTMDQSVIAVADYARLRSFFDEHPRAGYKVVAKLMSELSRRLRQTNERFVHSLFWSDAGDPARMAA